MRRCILRCLNLADEDGELLEHVGENSATREEYVCLQLRR